MLVSFGTVAHGCLCYPIKCLQGDIEEADEQRRPSAGGRKRKRITVESLMQKRVAAPDDAPAPEDGMEYLRWLLSG
jgi:general transcription factor IIIA